MNIEWKIEEYNWDPDLCILLMRSLKYLYLSLRKAKITFTDDVENRSVRVTQNKDGGKLVLPPAKGSRADLGATRGDIFLGITLVRPWEQYSSSPWQDPLKVTIADKVQISDISWAVPGWEQTNNTTSGKAALSILSLH